MKTRTLLLTVALSASTCLLTAQDANQPPDGPRPPGPEGRGPQLMPPRVAEQLNLAPEQREQVEKLEAEVKAKMQKILTPEQLQQVKQMRPPMQQGGPGGPNARMGGPGGMPNAPMGGPGMQRGMGGQRRDMPGAMGGQRPVMPLIEALDLNKDGIIQDEEIAKASESLKKLDRNGDGKLTPEEFGPPQLGGRGNPQGPAGQGRRGGPGGPGGPRGGGLPQRPPPEQ